MPISTPESEIHVWSAHLATLMQQPTESAALWSLLNLEETERARRMLRPVDRNRTAMSRAVLRTVLEHYTGRPGADLQFGYGAHGKPMLMPADGKAPSFSVSHSGDWLLIAITAPSVPVGIDLEMHRPLVEWADLAQRYFHPDEFSELAALSPSGQLPAFFDVWTRKEAVAKALGLGLSLDLSSFCVPVGELTQVSEVRGASPGCADSLVLVPPGSQPPEGYSIALSLCTSKPSVTVMSFGFQAGTLQALKCS